MSDCWTEALLDIGFIDPQAHYVGGGSPYVFDGSMPFDINPLVYFLEHAGSIIEGYG